MSETANHGRPGRSTAPHGRRGQATFAPTHGISSPGASMPAPPKPADTRRLYQQVADRIRAVIHEGQFGIGARLPPERELALQLGVSRPSLREALIALEIDGRVEIRGGSGVYVCTPPTDGELATSSLGESPAELTQARVVVESAIITLAAARVTKASLHRVEDALNA